MSHENEPADGTHENAAATGPRPGGLRERISRAMFNDQVREKLGKELAKASKKKGSGFSEAQAPQIAGKVTDAEIDEQKAEVEKNLAAEEGGNKKGPLGDWIKAHPDLVNAVVAAFLKLLLGA